MKNIYNNIVMLLLLFSTIAAVAMLYIAIFIRQAPKSLYFAYMILSVVFFDLGYLFELSGGGYEFAVLATKIQYLGLPFIVPFLFLFVCEYCAQITLKKWHIVLVMILPLMSAALVMIWPLGDIYYKQLVYVADTEFPRLIVTGGIVYYLYIVYMNIIAFLSIGIVLYYRNKGDDMFKKQTTSVLIGVAIPLLGTIVNVFKIGNLPFDPTPFVLSITSLLLVHAVFRRGLYMITSIAQEQIVENMSDGLILLDNEGLFIGANSAAKNLFPKLSTIRPGVVMPDLEELTWSDIDILDIKMEFGITDDTGTKKYYQASRNLIENNGKALGRSIMIHDITDDRIRLDEARQIAEHDALTGLINRGTLYRNGKAIFSQLGAKSSAAVLMMDVDLFKRINDNYGHLNGDVVLKEVAHNISSNLRVTDLVGRYGGEEFCVFLPRVNAGDIIGLAEKLRMSIENLELRLNDEVVHVTISIGVAIYNNNRHKNFESFLSDADAALYEAKNSGRNCVKCHKPEAGGE